MNFKRGFLTRTKPKMKDDNIRWDLSCFCKKNYNLLFFERNRISSASPMLCTPTILHERLLKSFPTLPGCGNCDVLFPFISSIFHVFRVLVAKRSGFKPHGGDRFLNSRVHSRHKNYKIYKN